MYVCMYVCVCVCVHEPVHSPRGVRPWHRAAVSPCAPPAAPAPVGPKGVGMCALRVIER